MSTVYTTQSDIIMHYICNMYLLCLHFLRSKNTFHETKLCTLSPAVMHVHFSVHAQCYKVKLVSGFSQIFLKLIRNNFYSSYLKIRKWVFAKKSHFFCFTSYSNPMSVYLWYFILWILLDQIVCVEKSLVYTISLQRYRDYTIWVCGKNSIPLLYNCCF